MNVPEALRTELHKAVDAVLDSYLPTLAATPASNGFEVTLEADGEGYTYQWPGGNEEYPTYRDYLVAGDLGEARMRVARTTRAAFGRNRARAVIFGQRMGSVTRAPWIEFVETDEQALFSAWVLDPLSPRRVVREGETVPPRFDGTDIRRTDELFAGVNNGPTLRLVVNADDEEAMMEHAYWVASLKGRL